MEFTFCICVCAFACVDAFVCVQVCSLHCAVSVGHKSTITVPLLPGHYYLKGIWCTFTHTHTNKKLGMDPEVWIPSGIVTVPLSDPGVQEQLERGIHLFLQWFTNTLYLCCQGSHSRASTPRYAWRENTSGKVRWKKKLSEKRLHGYTGTDWQKRQKLWYYRADITVNKSRLTCAETIN